MKSNQIQIQEKNDSLNIYLPELLRDAIWASNISTLQNTIIQYLKSSSSPKIVFDFNHCRWADPLPLMSILLEIVHAKNYRAGVEITLPRPDKGPKPFEKGPYTKSPNKLLLFLAQEGFLDCLSELTQIKFHNEPKGGWSTYHSIAVTPSYENMSCIPMKLFVVPIVTSDIDFARRSVENVLVGINSKLSALISPKPRERLIYKLQVALQETLHNAQEHAYETNDSVKCLVIYVRFRTGGLWLDSEGQKTFQDCLKEENLHCPLLGKDWISSRPGCLELFTIDRGIGIVNSFQKSGISLTWKHKFEEVMHKTFFDGKSTKKERQTKYGGLHLLYNILKDTGDFIRTFESGLWFGSGVPFIRSTKRTTIPMPSLNQNFGLAMHLRLGWKEETDHGGNWTKFTEGQVDSLWSELMLTEEQCASSFNFFQQQLVFDERFGDLKKFGTNGSWILWLVRPHRMKWDIITFIEREISPKASKNSILIIADIPSYEAETYIAALSEFKASGNQTWPSMFSKVIFTTNRLRFSAITYENVKNRHGFSKVHENLSELSMPSPPIIPKPENFRFAIVRWLKWFDSMVFWKEADLQKQMFIAEKISWGKGENHKWISGFSSYHSKCYMHWNLSYGINQNIGSINLRKS